MAIIFACVYLDKNANEHLFVDACNLAAGAFYKGDWVYSVFSHDLPAASDLHINYKEICAVVLAAQRGQISGKGKLWSSILIARSLRPSLTKGVQRTNMLTAFCERWLGIVQRLTAR